MPTDDPWLSALRQQASIVKSAHRDLLEARIANWKVLRAELAVKSVDDAYHRLLTDAPRASVVRHLQERADAVPN